MKRALFLLLIAAVAALQSPYATGQDAPAADPASDNPAVPTPAATTPPAADPAAGNDSPSLAPPVEPVGPPTPVLVPSVAPPAGTPVVPPPALPSLPLTIPGPGATIPPAKGLLAPPAGSLPPPAADPLPAPLQPQDPAAELTPFAKEWSKHFVPIMPSTLNPGEGRSPRYLAAGNVALTWSEEKDAVWGYSKSAGRWARQPLDPPATKEVPVLSNNLAVWQIGTAFYGFSSAAARWDVLKLPAESQARPAVDDDYALVVDGDDVHTFSVATGRWSSPKDAAATTVAASQADDGVELRQFNLKHANAIAVERTLRDLFADELRLTANRSGTGHINNLIARGKPAALAQLEALLKQIDRPGSAAPGGGYGSGSDYGGGYEADALDGGAAGRSGEMMGYDGGMSASPASREQLQKEYGAAERRAADLARKVRDARSTQQLTGAALEDLQQAVAQAFAARQRLHQHDLAALERRLHSTRETLSMRERIKPQIIERRVADLLNPNLEWDLPPTAAAPTPPASASVESSSNPQGLLALQAQTGRFHKLQERWDIVFALYKGGRVDIGEALRAAAEVYKAEAAIAATSAARVEAAERHVERSRALQEIVEAKFRNEVEPLQAKLAVDALVLETEAILAITQDGGNPLSARPATPPGPTAETTVVPPALKFASDLRGTWVQVAQERNGERTESKPGAVYTLTFDGNRYTLRQGTEKYASGTFQVGSEAEHGRELDTVRTWLKGETEETQRLHRERGIADLDLDRLRWCYGGRRADERPDAMATAKDDGRLLTEWCRISDVPLSDEQFRSIDLRTLTSETALAPSPAIPSDALGSPAPDENPAGGGPPQRSRGEMKIRILGLGGVVMKLRNTNVLLDDHTSLSVPSGTSMNFELPNLPTRGALSLHAVLSAFNETPRTALLVDLGPVDMLLAPEDIDQAAAGNTVVKVLYLPREGDGAKVESLVSTRLDPGVDPVEEAKKRGDLLVVLTLTKGGPPEDAQNAKNVGKFPDSRLSAVVPTAASDRLFTSDSQLILARPEEYRSRRLGQYGRIQLAEKNIARLEKDLAAGEGNEKDLQEAQSYLRLEQNKLEFIEAELAAQLKLLESNLQAAEAAADVASNNLDRATKLSERGATPTSYVEEMRLNTVEARSRAERAQTLLDLYRKIDALSRPAAEPAPDAAAPRANPASPPPAATAEPK